MLKAADLISSASKYNRATSYGAAKYVQDIKYDKETTEILEGERALYLNQDLIDEEEKLDGYYMIVTSEMDKSDEEIIDIYKGLWKIEESFKIIERTLTARTIFVSRHDHIHAHFLTCFVAVTLTGILEMKIQRKYCTLSDIKKITGFSKKA